MQPSPGELCNLGISCSRKKGCHPLIILKIHFFFCLKLIFCGCFLQPVLGAGILQQLLWQGAGWKQVGSAHAHGGTPESSPIPQMRENSTEQGFLLQSSKISYPGASLSTQSLMDLSHQPGLHGKPGKAPVSRVLGG